MKFADVIRDIIGRRNAAPTDGRPLVSIERPARRSVAPDQDDEPRFRTSATDRSETGAVGNVRLRLREAFMPSQPVWSRPMLAGRRTVLGNLIRSVEDQRAHVVLYGDRGIGKTSLLRVFMETAREADYLVIHENCGAGSTFDALFRSIAQQIPLLYFGALNSVEAQSQQRGTLADLLAAGEVGPTEIARLLSEVTGTRLIIILDEFDRVRGPEFQLQVAELIKNLSDASARVQLVIAGVAANLRDLLGHSPSIRRNIIGVSVERMSDSEVQQILEIGERHAAVTFDPIAKAYIVRTVQGFPYLTRLLAHHSSMNAIEHGRSRITDKDVEVALANASSEIGGQLSEPTRTAARARVAAEPAQIAALARLSMLAGGSFGADELREVVDSNLQPLFQQLAADGTLLRAEGEGDAARYVFTEEGLAMYLLLAGSQASALPPKDQKSG